MLRKGAIKLVQSNTKDQFYSQYLYKFNIIFKFNIYSPKKVLWALPCDKPKEFEQAHSLYPSQNGGSFSLEGNTSERELHMKDQTKRCIFFSAIKSQIPKICEFQAEKYNLSVSLPLLWPGTSMMRKLNVRLIIYQDDILLMAASVEELTLERDTLIYLLQNLGFLINIKKSVLQSCQTIQLLGMEITSIDMTITFPEEKKDQIVKKMSRSSEEVISFNAEVDSTYWKAGIKSHCSSASTTSILSNATPANIVVICSKKITAQK